MQYRSCHWINIASINFNGRVDKNGKFIAYCCEPLAGIPAVAFSDTAEETAKEFLKLQADMIETSKSKDEVLCEGCSYCSHYKEQEWPQADGKIHYVNMSMYPAPCQSNCFYCGFNQRGDTKYKKTEEAEQGYNKLFGMLEYYKENNLIADDAGWQVSTGEITIHPYKDRIMDLVGNYRTEFRTNCFKFDKRIAENLKANPQSFINLSIDAGTPETWEKIKGFDNFYDVTDNLVEYRMSCTNPEQITLKYIILPGVNDNLADFTAIVEIMNILGVPHLTLSREMGAKYSASTEARGALLTATAYLAAVLKKNNKGFIFHHGYMPEEQKFVTDNVDNLIAQGKI